jgi:hypothetical protein
MAEEEGFEPSVQVSSHGHLANDWFQPLTHSSIESIDITDCIEYSIFIK